MNGEAQPKAAVFTGEGEAQSTPTESILGLPHAPREYFQSPKLTVLKGKSWGRPDDKIGLAGAINGISKDHRDYLAVGGLGILIGDGRINYRGEKILETYYAMTVIKGLIVTFDYQFMMNPAHNADRGPISIFSGRMHGEF